MTEWGRWTRLWLPYTTRHLAMVSGLLLASLALWYARLHTALPLTTATVSYNGFAAPAASVYRTWDGNLIVRLSEKQPYRTTYIARLQQGEVSLANTSSVQEAVGLAFHRDALPGGVRLGTDKSGVEPKVVEGDRVFGFTTAVTYARVQIAW